MITNPACRKATENSRACYIDYPCRMPKLVKQIYTFPHVLPPNLLTTTKILFKYNFVQRYRRKNHFWIERKKKLLLPWWSTWYYYPNCQLYNFSTYFKNFFLLYLNILLAHFLDKYYYINVCLYNNFILSYMFVSPW